MKFYRVSYGEDNEIIVILAHNEFEAVGYYLINVLEREGYIDDVVYKEMSADTKIEVSCIGFPVYKTLEEIYKEKEFHDTPCVVCGLSE